MGISTGNGEILFKNKREYATQYNALKVAKLHKFLACCKLFFDHLITMIR